MFLFSPPERGVRCPLASLLARGNAQGRLAAFFARAKPLEHPSRPSRIAVQTPAQCQFGHDRLSLLMKGTDAFCRIALFAPENTRHTGAISAPAARERCSSMRGPQGGGRGRSSADPSQAMEAAAAKRSRTTLLYLRHEHARADACHATSVAAIGADREFGGEQQGHGHSLERPLLNASGRSNWVSIAICLPGTMISSR